MPEVNPYKPPVAHVEDVASPGADAGSFINGGRAVAAGRGWAWVTGSFDLFKARPGTWILIVIVLGLVFIGLGLVPFVGTLATWVLFPVFTGGIMLGCRALARDGELRVGHVFAGFQTRAGDLVVIGVLSIVAWIIVLIPLMLIVGVSVFLGFLSGDPDVVAKLGINFLLGLLITLGLSVPVYMALWFAPALVVLHEIPPVAALKQSFGGCLKNIVPFLVYGVVMLVLSVVAMLPLFLGLLVIVPMTLASVYVAYRDIYFEN